MRKLIICMALFLCFVSYMIGQDNVRRIIDSTKKELNTAKGNKRIDCLNLLAEAYYEIWDEDDKQLDTACRYTEDVYTLAKNSGYKKGFGYALLMKAHCYAGRTDNNINNNSTETNYLEAYNYANKAVQVAEEIKDYRLAGDVYNMLKWLERWRGDQVKFKSSVEKAIYYYEKPAKGKLNGHLRISQCDQCQGNEGELGWLYVLLSGFPQESVTIREAYIQKAIGYYEKSGSKGGLGTAYLELANSVNATIGMEPAIGYLKKAISYYREAGNETGELITLTHLNSTYWNLGDFENGLENAKKTVMTAKKLIKYKEAGSADSLRLGQAYFWMGRFYAIAGDFETAFDYLRRARPYYPKLGNWLNPWTVAIGDLHRQVGAFDSAMFYLGPLESKNWGQPMISYLYVSLKQYDKALTLINEGIKQSKEGNNFLGLGRNYVIAAKAHLGKKDYSAALTNARLGLALLSKMKRNTYVIEGYQTIAEIFNSTGNNDSAYFYLKQYTILKDSLLNRQFFIRLNDYKREAEEAKRIGQLNLLQKDYLIKEQELQQQILSKQQNEAQLALLDKDNEIKDQKIKEQTLLKEQNQSQLTLLDKENKLKDQRLKQQAFIRNALLGGLLLLILLSLFVFRILSLKRKNEKLAIKKDQAELHQRVAELEMQALRAQMNPHFIFNSLNSINRFIFKNETKDASDYLTRFSRLIRMVLLHSQKKLVPLEDELEMLKLYLDMERLRFKNAFDYHITTTNAVESSSIFIPPLLLQPFCENAIWHGLMHKNGNGHLNIELSNENGSLYCTIIDNGVGRDKAGEMNSKSAQKEKSLGLKITKERLSLLNQGSTGGTFYEIEDLTNESGKATGTKVKLQIRYKETVDEYA